MRFFLTILLLAFAAPSCFCGQGPRGVGSDIKAMPLERAKVSKPESTPPLYTVPKAMSWSWWHGGGPGPAGAGAD